jgi:hypothetical protein
MCMQWICHCVGSQSCVCSGVYAVDMPLCMQWQHVYAVDMSLCRQPVMCVQWRVCSGVRLCMQWQHVCAIGSGSRFKTRAPQRSCNQCCDDLIKQVAAMPK